MLISLIASVAITFPEKALLLSVLVQYNAFNLVPPEGSIPINNSELLHN